MPRLFSGIEIPQDLGDRLAALRGGLPGARWIDAANYHVTLRFVGDVDRLTAEDVADALVPARPRAIGLTVEGLSAFGTKKPHSIVARVAPTRELLDLQGEQERALRRIGLAPDARKFIPHVTLARLRGVSLLDIADYLSLRGGFSAGPYEVDRFVLFSSRDTVGGGPYLVEEAYPLSQDFDFADADAEAEEEALPWPAD